MTLHRIPDSSQTPVGDEVRDPVFLLYRYPVQEDQEVVGLLASAFAFGRVEAFLPVVERLLQRLGPHPAARFRSGVPPVPRAFRYRYVRPSHLRLLYRGLHRLLFHHGSLGRFVREAWDQTGDLRRVMELLYDELLPGCAAHPLLAIPRGSSALKRWALYFRWMVRKTPPDLGCWSWIPPRVLFVPLDTHIFQAARRLGWTRRSRPDWRAVEEITKAMRELVPEDPLVLDFPLYLREKYGKTSFSTG